MGLRNLCILPRISLASLLSPCGQCVRFFALKIYRYTCLLVTFDAEVVVNLSAESVLYRTQITLRTRKQDYSKKSGSGLEGRTL